MPPRYKYNPLAVHIYEYMISFSDYSAQIELSNLYVGEFKIENSRALQPRFMSTTDCALASPYQLRESVSIQIAVVLYRFAGPI